MTSHAATHAMGVFLVTRSATCAIVEFFAHFLVDFGKCEKWFSIHADQAMHIACKAVYAYTIYRGLA